MLSTGTYWATATNNREPIVRSLHRFTTVDSIPNSVYISATATSNYEPEESKSDEPASEKVALFLTSTFKEPPFTRSGRLEAGVLLGRLQKGESLSMPVSRPMPSIGPRCHELRVRDGEHNWRIVYRIDSDAILIAEIFRKKTRKTPPKTIELSRQRLARYDRVAGNS